MIDTATNQQAFRLKPLGNSHLGGRLNGLILDPLERALGLRHLQEMYKRVECQIDKRSFCRHALAELNVRYHVSDENLDRIPKSAALVVVANHPFGAIEGLILTDIIQSVRPDIKVMSNHLLACIPELHETSIFVDPFGHHASRSRNITPLKEAIRWLNNGGVLGVFPAGEVSHLNLNNRQVADPAWSESIARLIRHTESHVVPIFFHGTNGPIFQLAGMVHPQLRTAMLPRQLLNKRDQSIAVHIGHQISYRHLSRYKSDANLMRYLRFRTYVMAHNRDTPPRRLVFTISRPVSDVKVAIADPDNAGILTAELAALPEKQLLTASSDYQVFFARSGQIPRLLQEIGRQREIAFRAVGEGTGHALDLDSFDPHYLHLFVWNKAARELVGGYRLGLVDEILDHYGVSGLYTATLYRYRQPLLDQLSTAIELGRSFVRPEYQRSHMPLLMLWKGIAHFVARYPRYRRLFGTVSMSNSYRPYSRSLLVQFLRQNHIKSDWAAWAEPYRPFRPPRDPERDQAILSGLIHDLDLLSEVIQEVESDGKGVPILFRQYLKLGGEIIGFNVDNDFSHALDALIAVDLTRTEPALLTRYMGKDNLEAFHAFHAQLKHHTSWLNEPRIIQSSTAPVSA